MVSLEQLELAEDDRQRRAQIVADRFDLSLESAFALGVALALTLNVRKQRVEVVQERGEFCVWQRQMEHLILAQSLTHEGELGARLTQRISEREPAVGEITACRCEDENDDGG